MKSEAWVKYVNEAKVYLRENAHVLNESKSSYWLSNKELFARAFESYVNVKLQAYDRINSYLSAAPFGGFWPSKENSFAMIPHFEKIFDTFKNSDALKKALKILEVSELNNILKSFK